MSFFFFRRVSLRTKAILATLLLTIVCLAVWALVIEPNRLVVTEATIVLPGLPIEFEGMRIAAISDLHIGSNFITLDKLREVVTRTNALNPDLVVLLGDFVQNTDTRPEAKGKSVRVRDSVGVAPELLAQPLKSLRARHGVYAVLGNHDWACDEVKIKSIGLTQKMYSRLSSLLRSQLPSLLSTTKGLAGRVYRRLDNLRYMDCVSPKVIWKRSGFAFSRTMPSRFSEAMAGSGWPGWVIISQGITTSRRHCSRSQTNHPSLRSHIHPIFSRNFPRASYPGWPYARRTG